MDIQKLTHADVQQVNALVQELKEGGAIVLRELHSDERLAAKIQATLDAGKAIVFIPSRRLIQEYFSPQGFAHCMRKLLAQLNSYAVLIEPNFYGYRLIMAVGPMCAASTTSEAFAS